MRVLIQSAWWNSAEQLKLVEKRHRAVCETIGWRYLIDYGTGSPWRFYLILAALREGAEAVVSMDADSVICIPGQFNIGPLTGEHEVGMTVKGNQLHAGTMYLRNTHEAGQYIERCLASSHTHKWGDFPEFFSREQGNCRIARLTPAWDDWEGASGPRENMPVVKSFHRDPDKQTKMKKLLKELE